MFSELGEGCQALELVLKRTSYIDFLFGDCNWFGDAI